MNIRSLSSRMSVLLVEHHMDLVMRVCDRITVLDSCASGAFMRAKGGTRVAPFLVDQSARVTGEAVLTYARFNRTRWRPRRR